MRDNVNDEKKELLKIELSKSKKIKCAKLDNNEKEQ